MYQLLLLLFCIFLTTSLSLAENRTNKKANSGFSKASSFIRAAIDESVDPCEDFFKFSCGQWIANNKIPKHLSSYDNFIKLSEEINSEVKVLLEDENPSKSKSINNLKQIYKSCMDVKTLKKNKGFPLLKKLEEFGYWPILHGSKWNSDNYNLTKLLSQVESRKTNAFIYSDVVYSQNNAEKMILMIDQGNLGIDSEEYFLKQDYLKEIDAYKLYIKKKIILLSKDAGISYNEKEIENNVSEIVNFTTEIAKIVMSPEKHEKSFEQNGTVRLSNLSSLIDFIDWNVYFRLNMPQDIHNYLNNDPELQINNFDYFKNLNTLLKNTDKRIIVNYVLLLYTLKWPNQLDERYDDIKHDFEKILNGEQEKTPRWKICSSENVLMMRHALNALYVQKFYKQSDRKTTLDMINDLTKAFKDMLKENDWMDSKTLNYAFEKLDSMISLIGSSDISYNDTALDEYYAELTIGNANDFPKFMESLIIWNSNFEYRRILNLVDRSEFIVSSVTADGFINPSTNSIIFPAGTLQKPFFDSSFPKAVNYGKMGSLIGSAISGLFDVSGSQYDKIGNLKDWWNPQTKESFIDRANCIIDQYSAYKNQIINLTINGVLTQNTNIVDNAGIKNAFKAYRLFVKKLGHEEEAIEGLEKYTNNQIFFISFAQNWCEKLTPEKLKNKILTDLHPPSSYRVNGVVSNQIEFAEAFNCPAKSNLNPEKRCSIW